MTHAQVHTAIGPIVRTKTLLTYSFSDLRAQADFDARIEGLSAVCNENALHYVYAFAADVAHRLLHIDSTQLDNAQLFYKQTTWMNISLVIKEYVVDVYVVYNASGEWLRGISCCFNGDS